MYKSVLEKINKLPKKKKKKKTSWIPKYKEMNKLLREKMEECVPRTWIPPASS